MGFLIFNIAKVSMKFKVNVVIFGKFRNIDKIFSDSRNMQHIMKFEHGVGMRVSIKSRTSVRNRCTLSVAEFEIIITVIWLFE